VIGPTNPGGIIEAWNVQYLPNPFPVLIKLGEGYWPASEESGKLRMRAPGSGLKSADGREIGQYAVEGLTTLSNLVMRDHIRNQTKLKDVSGGVFTRTIDVEDANGKSQTETLSFGLADRSHFMQVQDFMLLDIVPRFGRLAVERVIWTAHEAKGDDDVTGVKNSVFGPATIGKATVGKTAMKFGDTFHLAKIMEPKKPLSRRAYYEDHPDENFPKMPWPAKLSLPLSEVGKMRVRFPGGYVPLELTGGLDLFFDFKYGEAK
jgi:hypothetical protein